MGNDGNDLYQLLIQLTGLEATEVKAEIDPILARLDLSPNSLMIDDVRKAMMVYLNDFSAQITPDEIETAEFSPLGGNRGN